MPIGKRVAQRCGGWGSSNAKTRSTSWWRSTRMIRSSTSNVTRCGRLRKRRARERRRVWWKLRARTRIRSCASRRFACLVNVAKRRSTICWSCLIRNSRRMWSARCCSRCRRLRARVSRTSCLKSRVVTTPQSTCGVRRFVCWASALGNAVSSFWVRPRRATTQTSKCRCRLCGRSANDVPTNRCRCW